MGWLRTLITRPRRYDELSESIREHLDEKTADLLDRGLTREEAERCARREFGNVTRVEERSREVWQTQIDYILGDARFAFRQLQRAPSFAATAILVLALGICASVSIFAFVDALLIKPLPYRDPSRLAVLFESNPLGPRFHLSYLDYLDWKRMNHVFTGVEAYDNTVMAMKTAGGTQRADGAVVGAGFFRLLGIVPALGRDFHTGEDALGAPCVTMISYSAWQRRFGGRQDILGKTVTLDGAAATIVGVLPREFYFSPAGAAEFWMPIQESLKPDLRGAHGILAIARLKDGVPFQTASADVAGIADRLAAEYPDADSGRGGTVVPLVEMVVGSIRPILSLLLSAAVLLLFISTANVSGLLLLRFKAREREIAVRSALGASFPRLVRQFSIEALALTIVGGAMGLCASLGIIHLLVKLIPRNLLDSMPYLLTMSLNQHTLLFGAGVMVASTVLFAVIGVFCASGTNLRPGMTEGARGTGTVWRRLGAKLVVIELCTATMLLVGAGLLARSFYQLMRTETGLQPDHLATLRLWVPTLKYPKNEQIVEVSRRVMAEVGRLPGVQSVAIAHALPISNIAGGSTTFEIVGNPGRQEDQEANGRGVSAGYFTTIRAHLLRGRWFSEGDEAARTNLAIVNSSFVQKYLVGQNPLGRQIRFDPSLPLVEIVGVVENLKEGPLDAEVQPAIYTLFDQGPDVTFYVIARTRQDPSSILTLLHQTIHNVDSDIIASSPETMEDRINNLQSTYLHRASAWLAAGFASVALLLSVIGLYGVVEYSVSQRTREIGVRMALGATRDSVYRMILLEAAVLIAVALAAGLSGSIGAATLMKKLLFHTQPWDGVTFGAVAGVLILCAMAACLIPANRAARVQPVEALRSE
jgi:macrolide transport system ATP-binding/permease protein